MSDTSLVKSFKGRIEQSKQKRRDLLEEWQQNVDYRRGKPFETDSDENRVAVNKDWSMTKSKQAQLFSQLPEVRLTPKHPSFAPATPIFAKIVNDTLAKERVGAAMDEVLPDVINAAGIGSVIVSYEATTEKVQVPAIDPSTLLPEQQLALLNGQLKLPMVEVDRIVDQRFPISALEPEDLLIPTEFTGSDFDNAPWLGHSGRMTWAEAKNVFDLSNDDKEQVLGDTRTSFDTLADDMDYMSEEKVVSYDEIFYWGHYYHEDEKYYKAIYHLVFVNGLEKPVINGKWKGQRFDEETGTYIGACRLPIRVLTLTHISGQAIPPSDSAIGRPQVNELIKIRSQMIQQREHSIPMRWMNTDLLDPTIVDRIMNGTWQGLIPVQGDGDRAFGEIAKASYPQDDYRFDQISNRDLHEEWSLGPNQMGNFSSGERSATEAGVIQQNFQTEIGYQRARVADFFVGIAEVLAGLLALYGDFELQPQKQGASIGQEGLQRLQAWDRTKISGEFVYTIRQDSTVRYDVQQRIQHLMSVLNMVGQMPFVNPQPIIQEIVELSGLDPAVVMVQPQPKGPDQPNISFRFSGEDLANPLAQSILISSGLMKPQDVEAAKLSQIAATTPPQLPGSQAVIPGAEPLQVPQGPIESPVPTHSTMPDISTMPRIDKRRAE